ncbi:carbohydrate ABC transporter permease [Halalkalibacter alkaliphilus]|uniref:Sugar ABC transporter permease n=1 Tax=Halalkalibacter alkaliphilus TaxID=2917993 RepID=A0A9X2A052_9BACI|nr:sugar ABC transporter permease [Halalkalibacter alkaliphilus]MCL7746812.1 sugar ABC transporter permease [Halalkalibacter alkaliphilus]
MKNSKLSKLTSFLFVLPYFVMFVCFLLIPIIYGLYISFHSWDLLSKDRPFVGLQNYIAIFDPGTHLNSVFFNGLFNTFKFVIFSVPLLVVIGLLLALLVTNLPKKVQGFFRTVYFIPYVVSVSVIAIVWLWLLDTNSGLINEYLSVLGLDPIPWLTRIPYAWISIVVATLWWTIGFNMILFINALNEVPEELYESASIDGASSWKKLIHITLPTIRPVMLFVFITSTIASFNVYGQPYLMTRGGPGNQTEVLLMSIVNEAFSQRQLGSASAMAILMALIMITISVIQFRINRASEEGKFKRKGKKGVGAWTKRKNQSF